MKSLHNFFRRVILPVMMLVVLFSISLTTTVHAQETKTVKVTTYSCCVRSTPSYIEDNICGWAQQGDTFTLLRETERFYVVPFKGSEGYISKNTATIVNSIGTNNSEKLETTTSQSYGIVVNSDKYGKLRVRATPSIVGKEIDRISDGTKVTIIEKVGNWYKIQYNNTFAYVHASYIRLTTSTGSNNSGNTGNSNNAEKLETTASQSYGIVVNSDKYGKLRVRATPSIAGKEVNRISDGTKVTIIETVGNWYKIQYNNTFAYVHASYIRLTTSTGSNNSGNSGNTKKPNDFSGFAKVVNTGGIHLNLRPDRSTNKNPLTYIAPGAIVKVLEDPNTVSSSFIKTESHGIVGYTCKTFLKFLSNEEYNNLPKEETLHGNVIAEWSTTIYTNNYNSRKNMKSCADFLNGTIIQPGESLSFYSKTHPQGFLYEFAPVYANNKTELDRGGGICQISTTIYGAWVEATQASVDTGIFISFRMAHGQDVRYADKAHEATIASSVESFDFRNVNTYPVKLEVNCDLAKNKVTVRYLKVT